MCGINGILGSSDLNKALISVRAMNNSLAHRGPDDEDTYGDENIVLGHRRLSIIDLSRSGRQPMTSVDGRFIIVYNGELYNYRELKKKLNDYSFKTNTDTEVIVAAFSKWGKNCIQYFEGMFAFAIWDKHEKQLFIVRDRLGIKPLYYHIDKDNIISFSSELRALLTSGNIPKKIDRDSVADYLKYQTVHAPNTIIEEVKMLMPGHYLLASLNKSEIFSYWKLGDGFDVEIKNKPYDKVCSDINRLLISAVEKRLVADVPFGAFLSGGIDSSVVVGIMSKVMSKAPDTFSVVFDEEEFSEAKYAHLVAKKFNANHHEIKLKANDFVADLPMALKAMDFPGGDGPNTYVVSKATKKAGITMALSGLGGDELFAGYDVFKRLKAIQKYKLLAAAPLPVKRALASLISLHNSGLAKEKLAELIKLKRYSIESAYFISRRMMTDERAAKIFSGEEIRKDFVKSLFDEYTLPFNSEYLLSRISFAEISTYMQNVLLRDTDQMSMAHALEVRVPFLDHHLVEYVLSVPDKYKFPHTPKKLLVDSLNNLLPGEIINRPKMGFTLPWNKWLRNELKSFCENNIKALSGRNFINADALLDLWKLFNENGKSVKWSQIWYLVVLEDWLQKNNIE